MTAAMMSPCKNNRPLYIGIFLNGKYSAGIGQYKFGVLELVVNPRPWNRRSRLRLAPPGHMGWAGGQAWCTHHYVLLPWAKGLRGEPSSPAKIGQSGGDGWPAPTPPNRCGLLCSLILDWTHHVDFSEITMEMK